MRSMPIPLALTAETREVAVLEHGLSNFSASSWASRSALSYRCLQPLNRAPPMISMTVIRGSVSCKDPGKWLPSSDEARLVLLKWCEVFSPKLKPLRGWLSETIHTYCGLPL